MTHVDSGLTNCVRLCQKKEDRALLKPSQSPVLQGGLLQCAVMGGRRGWLVEILRQALSLAYATLRLRHPGHPALVLPLPVPPEDRDRRQKVTTPHLLFL